MAMRKLRSVLLATAVAAGLLVFGDAAPAGAATSPCPAGHTTIISLVGTGWLTIQVDGTTYSTDYAQVGVQNLASLSFYSDTPWIHTVGWTGSVSVADWDCLPGNHTYYNTGSEWWFPALQVHRRDYSTRCGSLFTRYVYRVNAQAVDGWSTKLDMRLYNTLADTQVARSSDSTELGTWGSNNQDLRFEHGNSIAITMLTSTIPEFHHVIVRTDGGAGSQVPGTLSRLCG